MTIVGALGPKIVVAKQMNQRNTDCLGGQAQKYRTAMRKSTMPNCGSDFMLTSLCSWLCDVFLWQSVESRIWAGFLDHSSRKTRSRSDTVKPCPIGACCEVTLVHTSKSWCHFKSLWSLCSSYGSAMHIVRNESLATWGSSESTCSASSKVAWKAVK